MKLVMPLMLLGALLAVTLAAPGPAEACENCPCEGGAGNQVSKVLQSMVSKEGDSPLIGAMTGKGMPAMVNVAVRKVMQTIRTGGLFSMPAPIYWK